MDTQVDSGDEPMKDSTADVDAFIEGLEKQSGRKLTISERLESEELYLMVMRGGNA